MKPLTQTTAWKKLQEHSQSPLDLRSLFQKDAARFKKFSLETGDLFLDYSKNLITDDIMNALFGLAKERGIMDLFAAMKQGGLVNNTESRAVQHTELRNFKTMLPNIQSCLDQMNLFIDRIYSGEHRGATGKMITDVVNVGIGGSDLGPRFATEVLESFSKNKVRCHFVANIDAADVVQVLKRLNPEQTLFILSSKSFSTIETLTNAKTAKEWLKKAMRQADVTQKHMVAVTANTRKALEFGIDESNIFPLWDFVGGRYSVWSAIGLPIALSIGMDHFLDFLRGAEMMDHHFETSLPEKNMPLIMALLGCWQVNFLGIQNQAVIGYDQRLSNFYTYLQQLDMESNGKRVTKEGLPCDYQTGPLIWGGAGTNTQHSFFQWLHQGRVLSSVDFIVPAVTEFNAGDHHSLRFANCVTQSRALMEGQTLAQVLVELQKKGFSEREANILAPHKVLLGNHPSNTIVMKTVSPNALGQLIAAYEWKVFVQGAIWNINSFDQFGVELGKHMADEIFPLLGADVSGLGLDSSSVGLIKKFGVVLPTES